MTDELARLKELRERDPEIRRMVAIVCDKHDCHSPAMLLDVAPEAFDLLLEACESMQSQLGDD